MKESWEEQLEKDVASFSQRPSTLQAKEDMFHQIMTQWAPENPPSYEETQRQVSSLADATISTTPPAPFSLTLWLRRGAAVAAVLLVGVVGSLWLNQPPALNATPFSPPLAITDMPAAVAAPVTPYRTVATNNAFYLGYMETDYRVGTLDLLVYSRQGDVLWDTLSMVDSDGDPVFPTIVDQQTGIVTLPVADTEITLRVEDSHGHSMVCILPTDI